MDLLVLRIGMALYGNEEVEHYSHVSFKFYKLMNGVFFLFLKML